MTAWILSSRLLLLDKFSDIIESMDLNKAIENMFLAAIIGVASIGVSFISDMSKNIHAMTVSIQELNARMGQVDGIMKDHEQRIRDVEKTKIQR